MTATSVLHEHAPVLLDPLRFESLLRREMGDHIDISDVRLERVWPMQGRMAFQWSWMHHSSRNSLFGVLTSRPNGHVDCVEQDVRNAFSVNLYVPAHGLLLHTPDRDAHMTHLATCLDGGAMTTRLDSLCSGDRSIALEARLLGYKPRRRAAVGYRTNERLAQEQWVGKTHARGHLEILRDRHETLAALLDETTAGRIRVQRPLAYIDEINMVVFECDPGHTLRLVDPSDQYRATTALAALHALSLRDLPHHGVREETAIVNRWCTLIDQLSPGASAVATPMRDHLERLALRMNDEQRATIHRDFYGAQLLVSTGHSTIIDLDTLSTGDPAIDLGNLLAHIVLDSAHHREGSEHWRAASLAVVEEYTSRAGPINRQALEFYLVSSLLRLGAVHMFRAATGPHAMTLWSAGNDVVRCGLGGVV